MTGYMEMAKCNRKQRLLGKSIRRIRMRRNMTQRELANAAGLRESALRSYELGERSPKQNTLERIAETLDVAPACFDTYGIERYDELVHALFLLEDRFGIEPCADGSIRFTDEAIQSCVCTWREWGLKQVVEGERNSSVHKKQPSRIEKELAARGIDSYKTNLRELCRIAAGEAENIYDYRELLESWGVDTEFKRGRMYVTDTDNNRYAFSVAKLDADLGTKGLEAAFTANVAKSIHADGEAAVAGKRDIEQKRELAAEAKSKYLAQIRSVYQKYRKEIRGMEGMEIADIPKLKLPRPDSDIADDSEVKRLILACWRGADELRAEVSSTVMPKGKKNGGNAGSGGSQRAQQVPAQERPEPNKENGER